MGEEKVLTQAEIDALVSKVPPKPSAPVNIAQPATETQEAAAPAAANVPLMKPAPAPPPPAAAPPPTPPPAPPSPQPSPPPTAVPPVAPPKRSPVALQQYASGEVGNLNDTVADMARQVGKITDALQKINRLEEKVAQLYTLARPLLNEERPLAEHLAEIERRLNELAQAARGNYDLRDIFQCSRCLTQGMMAIHVKCTECGSESWMGWWPGQDGE